jgi:hypothetical protein
MAKEVESTATDEIQRQLLALLRGGQAHVSFEDAVKDFPADKRGVVPEGLPYSAWQIVEHIRITQRDILDFSSPPTGGYQPMEWPAGYWPETVAPPSEHAWDFSIKAVHKDLETFEGLITKPGVNLYKAFRWGEGQNLLREAMLIADHTSYHLGELVVLRRLLGIWHK